MALNVVILYGRLTRDPVIRTTNSDRSVASFSLAVDRDYVRSGEQRETDFFNVTAWGRTAEFVSRWFHKGSAMIVKGRMQNNKWVDNDGNNRQNTEVVADAVYFGDSSSLHSVTPKTVSTGENALPAASQATEYEQSRFSDLNDDGELPF